MQGKHFLAQNLIDSITKVLMENNISCNYVLPSHYHTFIYQATAITKSTRVNHGYPKIIDKSYGLWKLATNKRNHPHNRVKLKHLNYYQLNIKVSVVKYLLITS